MSLAGENTAPVGCGLSPCWLTVFLAPALACRCLYTPCPPAVAAHCSTVSCSVIDGHRLRGPGALDSPAFQRPFPASVCAVLRILLQLVQRSAQLAVERVRYCTLGIDLRLRTDRPLDQVVALQHGERRAATVPPGRGKKVRCEPFVPRGSTRSPSPGSNRGRGSPNPLRDFRRKKKERKEAFENYQLYRQPVCRCLCGT